MGKDAQTLVAVLEERAIKETRRRQADGLTSGAPSRGRGSHLTRVFDAFWKGSAGLRVAVSGSHSTGKSTLIAAFLAKCPHYLYEREAFESLADDIELTFSEGPTAEGLQALLEHTISAVILHHPGTFVVFERSPVDYLAYAAASRSSWPRGSVANFLAAFIPRVRASVRNLDLIAFLPVSPEAAQSRSGENPRFRRRVDEVLRRALVDDDYNLFGDPESPRVVELPPSPERQLLELIRLTTVSSRA